MSLNVVALVTDPRGRVRFLVSQFPNEVSIGITVEGALLRIKFGDAEPCG